MKRVRKRSKPCSHDVRSYIYSVQSVSDNLSHLVYLVILPTDRKNYQGDHKKTSTSPWKFRTNGKDYLMVHQIHKILLLPTPPRKVDIKTVNIRKGTRRSSRFVEHMQTDLIFTMQRQLCR